MKPVLSRFGGSISLNNENGTSYQTYTQTSALTISAGRGASVNAWGIVPIIASGDAINIDSDWIKYGGDDLDLTPGAVNHFMLCWTGINFYWTNKVVAP